METPLLEGDLSPTQMHTLHALRARYARQVRYPFLSAAELGRLEFLRYYFALHGHPPSPALSEEAITLGRRVELYLTGYAGRRI